MLLISVKSANSDENGRCYPSSAQAKWVDMEKRRGPPGDKSLEWVRWGKFLSMSEFRNKKNALLKEQIRTIDTDWGFKAIDDFGGIAHGQNSLKLGKRPISRMLRN